jgi:hypothetical protein
MPTDDTTTGAPVPKKAAARSTAKKAPAAATKAPARKAAATKTAPRPSASSPSLATGAIEQLVRDTAERVAQEVTEQLGTRIAQLEKEAKRARKAATEAAHRLADLGASRTVEPQTVEPQTGKTGKPKKAKKAMKAKGKKS